MQISKMHHIHLLHKDYANICSNGGLFADLAADINSHKAPDCTDRLYDPGKTYASFQEWLGDHSNVLDKD